MRSHQTAPAVRLGLGRILVYEGRELVCMTLAVVVDRRIEAVYYDLLEMYSCHW